MGKRYEMEGRSDERMVTPRPAYSQRGCLRAQAEVGLREERRGSQGGLTSTLFPLMVGTSCSTNY